MRFTECSRSVALKELLKNEQRTMSVYLPFGLNGVRENTFQVQRKNTLKHARKKIENETNPFWLKALDVIEREHQDLCALKEEHKQGRQTIAYFFNPEIAIRTKFHGTLKAHFSFAPYAELEPLVYTLWAEDPYLLIHFNPPDFAIYEGRGESLIKVDLKLPLYLSEGLEDSELQSPSWFNGFKEWLLHQNQIKPGMETFLLAPPTFAKGLKQVKADLKIKEENIFSPSLMNDPSKLTGLLLCKMVGKKLAKTRQNLVHLELVKNQYDALELIRTHKANDLFIEQSDWYTKTDHHTNRYYYDNPRAAIIARALKDHVAIHYTDVNIDNRFHIAAKAI